jgi:SHS2 domain-containing protein
MEINPSPDTTANDSAGVTFEIVEHTADWAIRVRGRDFAELLLNAAEGMTSLLVADVAQVALDEERRVALDAFDRESMLVEWLGELAYLAESEGLVFPQIELQEATPEEVRAVLRGGPAPQLLKHIKAVTYHNLEVGETAQGLEVTIVFDV